MPPEPSTTWTLATPNAPGAVAIIQLQGDIDRALADSGMAPVKVGELKLRDAFGIDRVLVVRWATDLCQLMPHGGLGVVRGVCEELASRGFPQGEVAYPEARSSVEARALDALARAASTLAVDLLLSQHDVWSRAAVPGDVRTDSARDRALNHLIDPPLVVALGPSNIGKSTLINALAGRGVSIVADEPGTTRDHVGVMLDLAGLVVRYVDTPGLRADADPIERQASKTSLELASTADLLLVCGDATALPPALSSKLASRKRLTLCLRSDLGDAPFPADIAVCAPTTQGLEALASLIREALVPATYLNQELPWKFWSAN